MPTLPWQAIADELSQVEARLAEGASSTKSGGGSNMSFMLSLSSGEFVGKDTGVESQSADALLATFIHFGQPLVYQSMVTKNAMRNEGITNRAHTPGLPLPSLSSPCSETLLRHSGAADHAPHPSP